METMKAIALRKSTRDFSTRPVSRGDLDKIVWAGCAAPVGMGEYETLRLAVITKAELLKKITAAGAEANNDPQRDILYGATALIQIFAKHGSLPAISMANAACVSFDSMEFEGVVGSLSGDDTFILIMQDDSAAAHMAKKLSNINAVR